MSKRLLVSQAKGRKFLIPDALSEARFVSSSLMEDVAPMQLPQHSLKNFNYPPRCFLPLILSNGANKEAR